LLLLARADAGQLKPALETMDLTVVMEHIVEDTGVLGAEADLQLEASLAPDVIVRADPALLHTALLNLATNAVKYNEPGGTISMKLAADGNDAVLTLGNSGPGIPADAQEHVFTRFGRVDAARQRSVDGMGLGLSLAREIARAHGGEVELASSRDGWTSFVLRIPRRNSGQPNGPPGIGEEVMD
ncbi:MAG: sensor histidine kinase, partial [Verrucomicrobiaceae bacterium]